MKHIIIYGTNLLTFVLGLIFLIGTNYSSYTYGDGINFVSIFFIILMVALIVCEITKIIKKYDGSMSKNAGLANICLFIIGILFLAQKSHGFFDFTNIIWGACSIAIGYVIALIANIIVMIRIIRK